MMLGPLNIHDALTAKVKFFQPEALILVSPRGRYILCLTDTLEDGTEVAGGMIIARSEDEAHAKLRFYFNYHQ